MSTESTETELDAAFAGGFDDEQPANQPAADTAAPTGPANAEATEQAAPEAEDELAGLPPKVRALLAEMETLRQAATSVPKLEQRLRQAEGRLGDLNSRVPAPTPPAPPRLDKVERVRSELPEVVEAMEELLQSREASRAAPATSLAEAPASDLEAEAPGWEQKVISTEFQQWLAAQDSGYREKVKNTSSEAVMLAAITRFDVHQASAAEKSAAAKRAAQTRQARADAAVIPNGSGRRAPTPATTLDDAFMSGFRGT